MKSIVYSEPGGPDVLRLVDGPSMPGPLMPGPDRMR